MIRVNYHLDSTLVGKKIYVQSFKHNLFVNSIIRPFTKSSNIDELKEKILVK